MVGANARSNFVERSIGNSGHTVILNSDCGRHLSALRSRAYLLLLEKEQEDEGSIEGQIPVASQN
jgi:hypothetical protein